MEFVEIRNAVFWWMGDWALCTLLDAAILAVILHLRGRKNRRNAHQDARKDG